MTDKILEQKIGDIMLAYGYSVRDIDVRTIGVHGTIPDIISFTILKLKGDYK